MSLQDLVKVLHSRWATVAVTAILIILGSFVYSLVQTPLYQASTRLFVSTAAGESTTDLYQGSRYSQERVVSYAELVTGETVAQRTIDRLKLNVDAKTLQESVTAKAKAGTVLINVTVLDASPIQARDIANALSDEFVLLAEELEAPSQGKSSGARVIVEQRASIPEQPEVPKKKRNLALGILLGGVLGVGIAVLRDRLDNTIKARETLEAITGTGTVGYIPFSKRFLNAPAISFESDNSGPAEAFRKLRTNLQFLAVDNPPRVIVVTSASPSEGKSTTTINIALALAEADKTVVLVDGDLRRPRLARYLDAVGSVGLSNVLSGATPLDEVLQQTQFPRLTLLASGPTPPNPSELLGSLAAEKMLTELRSRFDYVIIDSAPLLAVTDGAILAAKADGALIVVKAGKTKREHLAHAIDTLNDVGAVALGAVLNMMPVRGGGAYSYNYYSAAGYGDDSREVANANNNADRQAEPAVAGSETEGRCDGGEKTS